MAKHSSKRRQLSSVQQHYVGAREIVGEVLCVAAPLSPSRRIYRAVLEVSSLNFLLKSEEEQDALVERYRSMLKALTFPIQIVIRNGRLDLRPYLERVRSHLGEPALLKSEPVQNLVLAFGPSFAQNLAPAPTTALPVTQGWATLAEGLEELLQQISNRRTLIERHCYLIIPAPDLAGPARSLSLRKKRRRARTEELMARSLQELFIRVEMVQNQLAALGLRSRRLSGGELACVYYSFLTPDRALRHPLSRSHLAAVGHMPGRKSRKQQLSRSLVVYAPPQGGNDHESVHLSPSSHGKRRAGGRGLFRRRSQEHIGTGQETALPPDLLRLADLLAPSSIAEEADCLRVDDEYVRGIAVTAFPREVSSGGWLAPLLLLDEILELSFHYHPQNQAVMMRNLKRRRVGYASARVLNRRQGRADDPEMDVAHSDVNRLMSQLASGEERIFELSFLLLVRASTKAALDEKTDRILALLQTVFLDAVAHPTTFEQAQAYRSYLPEARDELRRTITLDTASLATTFPFISNALTMPGGAFLGLTGTGEPVLLDPWDSSLENPHTFVGGVTGAGKSYFGKLWLERGLLINGQQGERSSVIDPDGEYLRLADALGGTCVRLAPGSEHQLNPFDLIPPGCDFDTYLESVKRVDRLAEKIQDLHSMLDLMLADYGTVLSTREKALLDRALYEIYRRVGISSDPRTHYHQAPLLRDLSEVLKSGVCGPDDFELGLRLSRYVDGSLAGLFSNQTNVALDSHLLVWDIRDMRGDLRPIGIFLIADCLWTQAIYQGTIRRALYIDEAASLIEHVEGGKFLANLSRRARKRYLRLVVMTQNPELFVQDEWGSVIAANAAIKILKKQDRTSVKAVASRFGLTAGEARHLLAFGVKEALLFAGDRRVLLSVNASPQEHAIITTNPVELAEQAGRTLVSDEQEGGRSQDDQWGTVLPWQEVRP
jgi:hypothetical protein